MLYLRAQAPAMLAIAETVWLQLGPTMRSLYEQFNRKEPHILIQQLLQRVLPEMNLDFG